MYKYRINYFINYVEHLNVICNVFVGSHINMLHGKHVDGNCWGIELAMIGFSSTILSREEARYKSSTQLIGSLRGSSGSTTFQGLEFLG